LSIARRLYCIKPRVEGVLKVTRLEKAYREQLQHYWSILMHGPLNRISACAATLAENVVVISRLKNAST